MHHDVGSDREHRLVDGVAIRDVERRVGGGHDVVPHRLTVHPHVVTELAAGPGDEDLHGLAPGEAMANAGRNTRQ